MHIKSPEAIRDRRRFKTTKPPSTKYQKVQVNNLNRTMHLRQVKRFDPSEGETILKDGAHNRKIGGDVLVGHIRGAYLVTLSLEERLTCPKSCPLLAPCYGNGMPHARRWVADPAFLIGLEREIAELCAKYPGVLIRLHVLGDFYSVEYVDFWGQMLKVHPNLFCFGFTAHGRLTDIGNTIESVREAFPFSAPMISRFAIRHSHTTGPWGSEVVRTADQEDFNPKRVLCPEQVDAIEGNRRQTHCGSCAACWQTDANIVFLEH